MWYTHECTNKSLFSLSQLSGHHLQMQSWHGNKPDGRCHWSGPCSCSWPSISYLISIWGETAVWKHLPNQGEEPVLAGAGAHCRRGHGAQAAALPMPGLPARPPTAAWSVQAAGSFTKDFAIILVSRNNLGMIYPRMIYPTIAQTRGKTPCHVKMTRWEQERKKRNIIPPKIK